MVLGGAALVLWYIFVFAQSNTTELKFNQPVVVVGSRLCAPPGRERTEVKCQPAIRDDIGRVFLDRSGKSTDLYFTDNIRVTGYLIKPDEDTLKDYTVDGVIVDAINE